MKRFTIAALILGIILLSTVTCSAETYGYFIDSEDRVVGHVVIITGSAPEQEGSTFVSSTKEEMQAAEIYEETVIVYSEDALILWAYTNIFTAENMEAYRPHLAAFLSFTRKATQNSADIFLAYAALSELTDVAVAIINKAIELGADITIGE